MNISQWKIVIAYFMLVRLEQFSQQWFREVPETFCDRSCFFLTFVSVCSSVLVWLTFVFALCCSCSSDSTIYCIRWMLFFSLRILKQQSKFIPCMKFFLSAWFLRSAFHFFFSLFSCSQEKSLGSENCGWSSLMMMIMLNGISFSHKWSRMVRLPTTDFSPSVLHVSLLLLSISSCSCAWFLANCSWFNRSDSIRFLVQSLTQLLSFSVWFHLIFSCSFCRCVGTTNRIIIPPLLLFAVFACHFLQWWHKSSRCLYYSFLFSLNCCMMRCLHNHCWSWMDLCLRVAMCSSSFSIISFPKLQRARKLRQQLRNNHHQLYNRRTQQSWSRHHHHTWTWQIKKTLRFEFGDCVVFVTFLVGRKRGWGWSICVAWMIRFVLLSFFSDLNPMIVSGHFLCVRRSLVGILSWWPLLISILSFLSSICFIFASFLVFLIVVIILVRISCCLFFTCSFFLFFFSLACHNIRSALLVTVTINHNTFHLLITLFLFFLFAYFHSSFTSASFLGLHSFLFCIAFSSWSWPWISVLFSSFICSFLSDSLSIFNLFFFSFITLSFTLSSSIIFAFSSSFFFFFTTFSFRSSSSVFSSLLRLYVVLIFAFSLMRLH